MQIKKILLIIAFLFFTVFSFSLPGNRFPQLTDTDIPEAEYNGNRIYSDESLYGYIDGGAELYLEYGFDTLIVTDLSFKNHDIKIEVYRMVDPAAAFGIFSVSRFRCSPGKELTEYFCRSDYQLQFCKGVYYVSIVNSNATEAEQKLSETIATLLIDRIEGPSFNASLFFTDAVDDELMRSSVLVRGRLGIFNGASDLTDVLEQAEGYTALMLKKKPETLVSILFDSETMMNAFIEKVKIDSETLNRGEEVTTESGVVIRKICMQSLLLKIR